MQTNVPARAEVELDGVWEGGQLILVMCHLCYAMVPKLKMSDHEEKVHG